MQGCGMRFCCYADDTMLWQTIGRWLLVGMTSCLLLRLHSEGEAANDSRLAVFYCISAHVLFQLQASVHRRLRHFPHLPDISYLCLYCVQVKRETDLLPSSKEQTNIQAFEKYNNKVKNLPGHNSGNF